MVLAEVYAHPHSRILLPQRKNLCFLFWQPVHSPWRESFYIRDVGNRRHLGAVVSVSYTHLIGGGAGGLYGTAGEDAEGIRFRGRDGLGHADRRRPFKPYIPSLDDRRIRGRFGTSGNGGDLSLIHISNIT